MSLAVDTSFRVQLDCYHGPLDLLICLIRQDELEILEIAIARIASDYLVELQAAIEQARCDIDASGDFVNALGQLMEWKSRKLLPRQPRGGAGREEEEPSDARQELMKQLLELKRFKEVSVLLAERHAHRRRCHQRLHDDLAAPQAVMSNQPIRDLELWDLVTAFSRLMKEHLTPATSRVVLDQTPISVHMDRLEARVRAQGSGSMLDLLRDAANKPELIGRFLAILELIKTRRVLIERGQGDDWMLSPTPHELSSTDAPPPDAELASTTPPGDSLGSTDRPPELPASDAGWTTDSLHDCDIPAPKQTAWADYEPLLRADDGFEDESQR